MQRSLLHALLLASAFALPLLPPSVHAQAAGVRAYAPEDLWTLSVADQTRVISQEYREQSSGRQIPNDQLRFYLDQVRLSHWTFSKVKQDIAKSLGGNAGPNPPSSQVIRCESTDGRSRTCNTPWAGHSVLNRQLSSAHCTQGQGWVSSPGRVTVTRGCRAEFRAAPNVNPPGGGFTSVQCESNDGRFRSCGSNLVGRAQLQRQLSNTRCVENQNFGLRNGSVWVNGGCRGVFHARTGGNGLPGNYSVTCSSNQGRYTTCAWDARRGTPQLLQQLSSNACRTGYSWGYAQRTGLWVNHGCRARFGTR